ncbi:MAG: hypothetical protein PHH08_03495 [Candidatus ainarchaeum sp.]|nr:hypothetical protein [Candidatus ainarchaeum sp.]
MALKIVNWAKRLLLKHNLKKEIRQTKREYASYWKRHAKVTATIKEIKDRLATKDRLRIPNAATRKELEWHLKEWNKEKARLERKMQGIV